MNVDYNTFSKTFAQSRKNMRWPELEYFFSQTDSSQSILDIGCGSGRFVEQFSHFFEHVPQNYLGVDMSSGLITEAQNSFPDMEFIVGDMRNIGNILGEKKFQYVFLIASFHHLASLPEREEVLRNIYKILLPGGNVFLTNWNLLSPENHEKYRKNLIPESENEFGSLDFSIKIGEYHRYYHSFNLRELEYLFEETGFELQENRVFDTERNIISILQRPTGVS